MPQRETGFSETHVETDQLADFSEGCGKGVFDPGTLFHAIRFPEHRPALDFHVKEMQFLIPVRYLSLLIYPQQRVFYFLAVGGGFVDTDVYGESVLFGEGLQADDEGGLGDGLAERDGGGGVGGDVVGGFGEEERGGTEDVGFVD
jgi:hypothetical protein